MLNYFDMNLVDRHNYIFWTEKMQGWFNIRKKTGNITMQNNFSLDEFCEKIEKTAKIIEIPIK